MRRASRKALRAKACVLTAIGGIGIDACRYRQTVGLLPVDTNLVGIWPRGRSGWPATNRSSLRFEVRHIRNLAPPKENVPGFGAIEIKYWRATVGVALLGRLF